MRRLSSKLDRTRSIRREMTLDLQELLAGAEGRVEAVDLQERLARRAKAAWPRVTLKDLRSHAAAVLLRLSAFSTPADPDDDDLKFIDEMLDAWIRRAVDQARSRARKAGLPFDLSVEFVRNVYAKQHGRCRLSGISFSSTPYFPHTLVTRPFAPSLNRIDARFGYTEDNVELVCTMANFAMNGWDYPTLLTFCRGIAKTAGRRRSRRPDI